MTNGLIIRIGSGITLLLLSLSFVSSLLFCIDYFIISPSFRNLEIQQATEDNNRVKAAIENEIENIGNLAIDWANWDDTYTFAKDRNNRYIESNYPAPSLLSNNSNIDFFAVFDLTGLILIQGTYQPDINQQVELNVIAGTDPIITSILTPVFRSEKHMAGLLNTNHGIIALSAHPILNSQNQGPSRGVLVMGRFLTDTRLNAIAESVQVPFNLLIRDRTKLTSTEKAVFSELSHSGTQSLQKLRQSFLYQIIHDIENNPLILLRSKARGEILHIGRQTRILMNSILFGLAFALLAVVVIVRDLRQISENSLRESEKRYRTIFANDYTVMLLIDPATGAIVDANPAAQKYYGWSIDELKNKKIMEINRLPEKKVIAAMKDACSRSSNHFLFQHAKANGSISHVEVFSVPIIIKDTALLLSIIHDISERKRAEEALQESQNRLEAFYNSTFQGIAITEQGKIKDINRQLTKILGYARDEMIGKEVIELVAEEDREFVLSKIRSDCDKPYSHKALRKDSSIIFVEAHGQTVQFQGRSARVITIQDITKIKVAQEALKESEKKFRNLVDHSPDILYSFSEKKGGFFVSNRVKDILGYEPKYIMENPFTWNESIHPEDRERVNEALNEVKKGKTFDIEYRIKDKNGDWHWFRDRSIGIIDAENDAVIDGLASDITERKVIEEALKHSERNMASVLNNTQDVIVRIDKNLRHIFANPALYAVTALSSDQYLGKTNEEIGMPKELCSFWREKHESVFRNGAAETFEFSFPTANNGERDFQAVVTPEFDDSGHVETIVSIMRDITDINHTQKALRESEERYRNIVENAAEGLGVVQDRVLRYINPRFCEIARRSEEELLGKCFLIPVHPGDHKMVMENYHKRMAGKNVPNTYEVRGLLPSGKIHWISLTAIKIKWEGKPAIQVFATDITDRKQAEEQLINSLKEKEILLSEVHHRVKNNLSVIISLLNLQASQTGDNSVGSALRDSRDRIRSMALIHEHLYQSYDFARIKLKEYTVTLGDRLIKAFGVMNDQVTISYDIEDIYLDLEQAIPFGLMLNELLTNALKHAFPDGRGQICVNAKMTANDRVELEIHDNGVGLPEDLDLIDSGSLGLNLITLLAKDQLGGDVEMMNVGGAYFSITWPKLTSDSGV